MVEGDSAICAYCGSSFVMSPAVCPHCGTVNSEDDEACLQCGEPLTTMGRVFQRHQDARRPPQFLQHAREQAPSIKRSEAEASRLRTETFNSEEAKRLENLRIQHQVQAAKDRKLILIGLAFLACLVVLLLLVAVVQGLAP